MRDFLSLRAWLVFIGSESILAGMLWMIGLLSPVLLIAFGLLVLMFLWIWENPQWIPRLVWGQHRAEAKAKPSDRFKPNPEDQLILVENKSFTNESRLLDGYYYKNCHFHNARLTFNGGNYTLDGGRITGNVTITSATNAVVAAYDLMHSLQFLGIPVPGNTKIERGPYGDINVTIDLTKSPVVPTETTKEAQPTQSPPRTYSRSDADHLSDELRKLHTLIHKLDKEILSPVSELARDGDVNEAIGETPKGYLLALRDKCRSIFNPFDDLHGEFVNFFGSIYFKVEIEAILSEEITNRSFKSVRQRFVEVAQGVEMLVQYDCPSHLTNYTLNPRKQTLLMEVERAYEAFNAARAGIERRRGELG